MSAAVQSQLRQGMVHFKAGRLQKAAAAYRSVLGRSDRDADVLHVLAIIADQQGRWDEALRLIDRAIATRPDVIFHNFRAGILRHLQRDDDALAALQAALALTPDDAALHTAIGNLHRDAARYDQAIAAYEMARAIQPNDLETETNLSVALHNAHRTDDAIHVLKKILEAGKGSVQVYTNLALLLFKQDRFAEAEPYFRKAAEADPDSIQRMNDLAVVLSRIGRVDESLELCRRALAIDPNDEPTHRNFIEMAFNAQRPALAYASCLKLIELKPDDAFIYARLGMILGENGRFHDAITACRKAIDLDPNCAEAYFRIVPNLTRLGKHSEALAMSCKLVELIPDQANAYSSFGVALSETGRWEDALAMCGKAIELEPNNGYLHQTMARIAWHAGALDAAIQMCDRMVQLEPTKVQARWDRAMMLLTAGRFEEGWDEYEYRWQTAQMRFDERDYKQPRWNGEDLHGKTILLYAEQGQGDTINFVRYVEKVVPFGGRIILHVQKPLKRLMQNIPGVDEIYAYGETLPHFDVHSPLLSLPRVFHTNLENIPNTIPYLQPEPELLARWQARMADKKGLKVGLVWAGSPVHWNDANRSIAFSRLAPLLAVPGIDWCSLQVGIHAGDIADAPPGLIDDLTPELTDFAETAAAMATLDLVIAVDTSSAHLAGALGVPVWMLVPFTPDWRWLLHRKETPWYPSMRLFRQPKFGDWDSVISGMATALAADRKPD